MKKCKTCGVEKDLDSFYKEKRFKSGYYGSCIACYQAKYYSPTNLKNRINACWSSMRSRIKAKRDCEKTYKGIEIRMTKQEFVDYALDDPTLRRLHDEWLAAGMPHRLAPSIDRINSKGHYEFGNIRFVTLSQNTISAHKGRKYTITDEHKAAISRGLRKSSTYKEEPTENIVNSDRKYVELFNPPSV